MKKARRPSESEGVTKEKKAIVRNSTLKPMGSTAPSVRCDPARLERLRANENSNKQEAHKKAKHNDDNKDKKDLKGDCIDKDDDNDDARTFFCKIESPCDNSINITSSTAEE